MSKIKKVTYGNEDPNKVDEIINVLTVFKSKFDNLSPKQFDEEDIDARKIDGQHYKYFYLCHANSISGLSERIFFKNSNYITCFSNLHIEGICPEDISVLLKSSSARKIVHEVLSTQILEYFDCNVPFNFFIRTENPHDNYLGSVDFISEYEKFSTLRDLNIMWTLDLNGILLQIEDYFKNNSKTNIQENKNQIIKTFLARICVLVDCDFDNYNCGFLINNQTNQVKFINFDFELALTHLRLQEYTKIIYPIMLYSATEYPEIYEEFIFKVKDMYNVLNEVSLTNNDEHYNETVKFLKDNLLNVININDKLLSDINNVSII